MLRQSHDKPGSRSHSEEASIFPIGGSNAPVVVSGTSGIPLRGGHLRSLDGLRGVALLIVFLHHLNYTYPVALMPPGVARSVFEFVVENGWAGVDIFFVLSGFLITSILLKSREATNYYRVFYMRRVFRIFPLYYLVVAFVFLSPWPHLLHQVHYPASVQVWYWLNLSNLPSALNPGLIPVLSLFWSLAVEEQFYLIWPTVVRMFSQKALLWIALLAVPVQTALRMLPWVQKMSHLYPDFSYRLTPLHCDGLFLGSALALLMAERCITRKHLAAIRAVTAISSATAIALLVAGAKFHATPLIAVAVAGLIALLNLENGSGVLSRIFSFTPLRLIGRYSYFMYVTQVIVLLYCSTYLFHAPAVTWTRLVFSDVGTVVVSFALGAISWKFFEEPINGWKRFFPYELPNTSIGMGDAIHRGQESAAVLR